MTKCYRVTHIDNLQLILKNGLVCKRHEDASDDFVSIGNPQIINVRDDEPVRIKGYGTIGEYVPFYFTPLSPMMYNIVTGYNEPVVPRRSNAEIIVICCTITKLAQLPQWFFTDGQANAQISNHFNDLDQLKEIDMKIIRSRDFQKDETDYDKPRRYQAEFLVHNMVPIDLIDEIIVHNDDVLDSVVHTIQQNGSTLVARQDSRYFF